LFRPYPELGLEHIVTTGSHAGFSRTPPPPTVAAPRLAADTVAVLAEAGIDEDRLAQLLADGTVVQAPPPTELPTEME
jgi:crotonobetainyl-CoA:carnitine CoA-transferase CaiB-like acyl-CoA transferase